MLTVLKWQQPNKAAAINVTQTTKREKFTAFDNHFCKVAVCECNNLQSCVAESAQKIMLLFLKRISSEPPIKESSRIRMPLPWNLLNAHLLCSKLSVREQFDQFDILLLKMISIKRWDSTKFIWTNLLLKITTCKYDQLLMHIFSTRCSKYVYVFHCVCLQMDNWITLLLSYFC